MGWLTQGVSLRAREEVAWQVELVYELLDAHGDTVWLAADLAGGDPAWELHLRYLQDLQRTARERLARLEG